MTGPRVASSCAVCESRHPGLATDEEAAAWEATFRAVFEG
jgi:hypothetical protein